MLVLNRMGDEAQNRATLPYGNQAKFRSLEKKCFGKLSDNLRILSAHMPQCCNGVGLGLKTKRVGVEQRRSMPNPRVVGALCDRVCGRDLVAP